MHGLALVILFAALVLCFRSSAQPLGKTEERFVRERLSYFRPSYEGKQKKPLTEENLDEDDLVNKHNPAPIMHHREYHRQVKPIVKGSRVRHRAQSQQPPTQASLAAAATKSKFLAKTSNQNNTAPTAVFA